MPYTTQEIEDAVAKFLRPEVRHPVDAASGVRKTDVSFTDLQEAAASVFVMEPDSVFYVTYLASKKTVSPVNTLRDDVQEIYDQFDSLLRQPPQPLDDLSTLANAASALTKMEAVSKNSAPKNLSTVSSYALYETNVNQFLERIKPSIVHNSDVVQTTKDLRSTLPGRVAGLSAQLQDITTRVQFMHAALDDYQALKLPSVLTTNVLTRARRLVNNRYVELESKTLEERQEGLRDLALELISSKGVVRQLGQFSSPTDRVTMVGSASGFADADHPCEPANVETLSDRLNVQAAANVLTFELNGGAPFNVTLPVTSDEIVLRGSAFEPFNISGGTPAHIEQRAVQAPYTFSVLSELHLTVRTATTPTGDLQVDIPAGTYTDGQLAAVINGGITASAFAGQFFAFALVGGGFAIESSALGPLNFIAVSNGAANAALGLTAGQNGSGTLDNSFMEVRTGVSTAFIALTTGVRSAQDVVDEINAVLIPSSVSAEARVVEVYPSAGNKQYIVEVFSSDTAPGADLEVTGVRESLGMQGVAGRGDGLFTIDSLEGALRGSAALTAEVDIESVETSGARKLVLTSKDTTASSAISVSGSAASATFSTTISIGTSSWVQMSDPSKEVKSGDLFQYRDQLGNLVLEEPIVSVSEDLLQLTTPLPVTATVPFTPAPVWVTIARAGNSAFTAFQAGLELWMSRDFTQTLSELTRYANATLADKNPSSAEISAVKGQLQVILDALDALVPVLEGYSISSSAGITDLIRDYSEKGADRALDTLLECRFGDFFGMSADDSSYAGNLMSGLRDLARMDYPIDRRDRLRGGEERVFARTEGEDPEFEYDESQLDPGFYSPDEVGQPDTF